MKVETKGFKDESCTLQFAEEDAEESTQVISDEGATHSCFILTKPGIAITLQCTTNLPDGTEEFIECVVDGVSRSMTALRQGHGKKYNYKTRIDKVLSYRFDGGKKKGLKIYNMEAQLRNDNIKTTPGATITTVSTIEVQHWRKYSDDSDAPESGDQCVKERAPKYDQFPRWSDREQTFSDDPPHEYSIEFTGDGKSSKVLKDRMSEEKVGFKHFRTYKFHLVSPEQFQKLGGTTPSTSQSSPQVVVPAKNKSQDNSKEKTTDNDKKVSKSVKGKEKESVEPSKAKPEKALKAKAEKSSSNVAKPAQKTGEKKSSSKLTTNGKPESDVAKAAQKASEDKSASKPATEGKPGECATPIDLRSQSPDFDEWPSSEDEDVEIPSGSSASPSPLPEEDGEKEDTQEEEKMDVINHTEVSAEKQPIIPKESQDVLDGYHATVEELIQEDEAINSFKPIYLEEMDIDVEMEEVLSTPVARKRSVVYGMPGGPADKVWRARDQALAEAMCSSPDPMEGVQSARSSTPIAGDEEVKGTGSTDLEKGLMTPPPSTQKKLVQSIEGPGSPRLFNNLRSPTRALSPLRNVHQALEEHVANAVTAVQRSARRLSFEGGRSVEMDLIFRMEEGARQGNIGDLNSLDLSVPFDSNESRFAKIPRPGYNRRAVEKGMSASPAPESIPDRFRQPYSKESALALFRVEKLPVPHPRLEPTEDDFSEDDRMEGLTQTAIESSQQGAKSTKPVHPREKAVISKSPNFSADVTISIESDDDDVSSTIPESIQKRKKKTENKNNGQDRLPVPSQHLPLRTPSPMASTPTIPPRPKKAAAPPRASTPPTPTPKSRHVPAALKPSSNVSSSKQPVITPVAQLSNLSLSKPTSPVVTQPKPSKTHPPNPTTPVTPALTSTLRKRKTHPENTTTDPRATKKVTTSTSTTKPAVTKSTDLSHRKEAAMARLEKAQKIAEELGKREALLDEIKGIEEEAKRIEGENERLMGNIERFGRRGA